MVQEMVVQVCYGTGNGCSGVMAQEMVVQVRYGTGNGCADMLWHRNRLCRCVIAQKKVT